MILLLVVPTRFFSCSRARLSQALLALYGAVLVHARAVLIPPTRVSGELGTKAGEGSYRLVIP